MTAQLSEVLAVLERLAPLQFAEPWDNVGLLLEPVPVAVAAPLHSALLTIDLSDEVVAEAERLGAKLIIAYHPPIFQGLKRLRSSEPSERSVLRCVASGIAVFSPHTALDAAPDGVNAWLCDAFGAGAGGSLFEKLTGYDLFVTGEMRHHDVRARALGGSSVVLSEHTHTERGFLPVLAQRLRSATEGVTFHLSQCDREPLSLC